MFPEVKFDDIIKTHGMNISITTTTDSDEQAYRLLELVGIPFSK
jgi:large subunit ribosomal protein L5